MGERAKSLIIGALVLAALVFFFLFWQKSGSSQKPVEVSSEKPVGVHVEIFTKPVFITKPHTTEKIEAVEGKIAPEGAVVSTGPEGRAQLVYPDGTVTRIDHNSQVTLTSYASTPKKTNVHLDQGKIWSRIVKLAGSESYQTQTNTTVATVRGTSYGHEIVGNGTDKILSTKHDVDGECLNKTQEKRVKQGNKVLFTCKEGEDAEESKISDTDKDDEWYIFNNKEDEGLDKRFGKDTYSDEDEVLGEKTEQEEGALFPGEPLVDCVGADGKISRVSRETCDSVKSFWDTHPPAPNPKAPDCTNCGSGGSSTSSNPTPTPTPLPDPTITSVTFPACGSSSCTSITTIRVDGLNYSSSARVEASVSGTIYSESTSNVNAPDASKVGGDDATYIITDFYNFPVGPYACTPFDVIVYFTTAGDTRSATQSVVYDPYGSCSGL